uniref:G-protein coupled receptors family 1 profile domain-containing protein n=1 Tax=Pygocentrus nattereri TaxID=42514 RepID=A0A3B4DNY2_PYGNA
MANNSSSTLNCGVDNQVRAIAISSLYFLLFLPALLLNLLVAWISVNLKSKTTFMVYLKHLVAADLLMTLTFPVRAASELPGITDRLQAFACRYSHVFFYLAMNMSIILMGLISLDRFFKIVRPGGRLLCQNLRFSKVLSVVIWLLLISMNTLPVIITTNQDPFNNNTNKSEICMSMKSKIGLVWHKVVIQFASIIFWAACIVITLSYMCITKKVVESYHRSRSSNDQGKRKAKVRVFLILLVFLVCYVPYYIVRIPYTMVQVSDKGSCTRPILKVVKDLTLWLSSTNVCLDPLIYFFLCKAFRKRFMETCEINRLFPSFGKTSIVQLLCLMCPSPFLREVLLDQLHILSDPQR